jgi:dTDP-4-amino-4,6-dideoxygalactose transaminase
VAYDGFLRMISLPLNPSLSDQDVTDVIEAVLDLVRVYRR